MHSGRILLTGAVGLVLGFLPQMSCANNSVGFDIQGGVGTHGFDVSGSLDLKPDPAAKPWEASVTGSTLHTTVGTESRANELAFSLSHEADENTEGHGSLTSWRDTINNIRYVGPTLGVTYTWLEGAASRKAGEDRPSGDKDEDQPDRAEIAALTFDTDIFFYTTDIAVSSRTVTVRRSQMVLPGGRGSLHDTQIHPNLSFEKPILDESLIPYLTVGHYFYSKDPAALENVAGRPRMAASAGNLNSLVGGFLNNNCEIGIRFLLPSRFSGSTKLGAEQTATDNSWATIQDITLARRFWENWKAKIEWTRTIQDGASADLFSGGFTYYFN